MSLNIKEILENKSNDYSSLQKSFSKTTGKSLIFDSCSLDTLVNYNQMLSASIVIPVWNGADTILSTLTALEKSSFNIKYPRKLQIIVADDGSTDNTLELLNNLNLNIDLTVLHQSNHGQGPAMNAGISAAEGDIIIEVDADTVLNYFAIENLMFRHQFHKNALYTGFRSYVDKFDPRVSLDVLRSKGPDAGFHFMSDERIQFPMHGWPNNMCLVSNNYHRLGNANGLWMANDDNDDPWTLADMVFGMLFSLPRDVFKKIGGFDERFKGWGCDDGYVGAKAISEGLFVIPVYTATGFHISHPFRTENVESEYAYNRKFFSEFVNSTNYNGHPDWISIAKKRVINKFIHQPKAGSFITQNISQNTIHHKEFSIEELLALGKFEEVYKRTHLIKEKNESHDVFQCKALNGLGKYNEVIQLLKNKKHLSEDLLFELSMAYTAKGNFIKASSLLNTLAESNPNYPELNYWLYRDESISIRQGLKYMNEKFYDVAIKCFNAALIVNHSNKKALLNREICLNNKLII
jgi:glycosyltransferase involved in cell wall biosynthesis